MSIFGGTNGLEVKFEALDLCGGIAVVGSSRLEFEIVDSNVCFCLDETGRVGAYCVEESINKLNIGPLRLKLKAKTTLYNGELRRIYSALDDAYKEYAERINAEKNAEFDEIFKKI